MIVRSARTFLAALLCTALILSASPSRTPAGDPIPFTAAAGLALTDAAARAWAFDAYLVYVENDEPLVPGGTAGRWGYLYYSPFRDECRGYSVEEGEIVHASDLDMKFFAPPIEGSWIDSPTALLAAEEKAGAEYRKEDGGALGTMLLMRGAFDEEKPDRVNWLVVYSSPSSPSLFVVVNAESGKVTRTWRG